MERAGAVAARRDAQGHPHRTPGTGQGVWQNDRIATVSPDKRTSELGF